MNDTVRIGLIDVGSNSVKLLVADVNDAGLGVVDFAARTTRLGEALPSTGRVGEQAARRTAEAAGVLARRARRRGARVFAIGTDALRRAVDADRVRRAIESRAGVSVRVVSPREEGLMVWEGARAALSRGPRAVDPADVVLFDLGGGSCEIVRVVGGIVRDVSPRSLGALHLMRRYEPGDPVDPRQFGFLEKAVRRNLAAWRARIDPFAPVTSRTRLVASGGGVTSVLNALVAPGRPRDVIERARVQDLLERCLARSVAQRRQLPGIPADRAEIVPAGLVVVRGIMDATGRRRARVYAGGVREGAIRILWRASLEWPAKIAATVRHWEAGRKG